MSEPQPKRFKFNDLPENKSGARELSEEARDNLQCSILTSTGRARSKQVFRRFKEERDLWNWLERCETPTASTENDEHDPVVTILFSAEALKWLGAKEELDGMDPSFRKGARDKAALRKLGAKNGVEDWAMHAQPWHVVEIHSHDHDQEVEFTTEGQHVVEHGTGIAEGGGETTGRYEHSHGHFQIIDGVSKFVYRQCDYDRITDKPAQWTFDPRQKLSTLLLKDPFADKPDCYGSYFVFAKYRQDVDAFEAAIARIIEELGNRVEGHTRKGKLDPLRLRLFQLLGPKFQAALVNGSKKSTEALRNEVIRQIFGRDQNGETAYESTTNDFTYEAQNDQSGTKCPFHAHIRKMNPRGSTGNPEFERERGFARRGISYNGTTGEKGEAIADTGLLFWSAQASIEKQFEYVMEYWANLQAINPEHDPIPDIDAVIGSVDETTGPGRTWRDWKDTTHLDFNIWNSVQLVGAEYLYAPSIPGFKDLQHRATKLLNPFEG